MFEVHAQAQTPETVDGVGIGYGDDIDAARAAILKAVAKVEGIEAELTPEVLVWDLAESAVVLRLRWWTKSVRTDVVHVQAAVLEAIKHALDEAGIDMPFDTKVLLQHDQTEELDGKRGQQREDWPRPAVGEAPQPVRKLADRKAARAGNGECA